MRNSKVDYSILRRANILIQQLLHEMTKPKTLDKATLNRLEEIEQYNELLENAANSLSDEFEPKITLSSEQADFLNDRLMADIHFTAQEYGIDILSAVQQANAVLFSLNEYQVKAGGDPTLKDLTDIKQNNGIHRAAEVAYQSYNFAIDKNPALVGKKDVEIYEWLKENGNEDYNLPSFDTWQRQVRTGRKHYHTSKNTPRAGRRPKTAIDSNDPAAKQITNKFNNLKAD